MNLENETENKCILEFPHNKKNPNLHSEQSIQNYVLSGDIFLDSLISWSTKQSSDKETTKETLKWVHITISNAKRNLLGNFHKIKRKYLQLYLNEFVYKLNRRYFEEKLFDRLVIAGITGL